MARLYADTPVVRGGPMNPPVSAPDVARGDSAYLVVWQGQDSLSEHYHINARFIWPDNPAADTAIFPIRTAFMPSLRRQRSTGRTSGWPG